MTQTGIIFNIQRFAIHDGPGIRTTVFFKGCPLRCWWCHNPESHKILPEKFYGCNLRRGFNQSFSMNKDEIGKEISVDELMNEINKDRVFYEESSGGVTLASPDIDVETVPDARVPVWEKLSFLAPIAGFAGAAREPTGTIWGDPFIRAQFLEAVREVERVARAEGVPVAGDLVARITTYVDALPPAMRPSLLIDLSLGKRIEVESLQGEVVRRGQALCVPTPIMATLYAVLKPHAGGSP